MEREAGEPEKRKRPEAEAYVSDEAEERRRGHGVDDAGSAFRAPDRTRGPRWKAGDLAEQTVTKKRCPTL